MWSIRNQPSWRWQTQSIISVRSQSLKGYTCSGEDSQTVTTPFQADQDEEKQSECEAAWRGERLQGLTVSPIFRSAHFLRPGSGFPSWQVAVKERLMSSGWSHTDSSTLDRMFWGGHTHEDTQAGWYLFIDCGLLNKNNFAAWKNKSLQASFLHRLKKQISISYYCAHEHFPASWH